MPMFATPGDEEDVDERGHGTSASATGGIWPQATRPDERRVAPPNSSSSSSFSPPSSCRRRWVLGKVK
jgi:hypothetical protein